MRLKHSKKKRTNERVREIQGSKLRWRFASVKMSRIMHCESRCTGQCERSAGKFGARGANENDPQNKWDRQMKKRRQKHFRARQFSKKRVRRRFASLKLKRMVYAESLLEKNCFRLLDFDSDVIYYREQPFKIFYFSNGDKHHYTPDIEVIRRHKKQIVEVKPFDQLNKEENIRNFEVGKRYALDNGYEYVVMTEKEICGQLLENIEFLYRYARQGEVPFQYKMEIKKILESVESISIKKLAETSMNI